MENCSGTISDRLTHGPNTPSVRRASEFRLSLAIRDEYLQQLLDAAPLRPRGQATTGNPFSRF